MRRRRLGRLAGLILSGGLMLQTSGCNPLAFNELLQTIFLGITAAGSLAILDNL